MHEYFIGLLHLHLSTGGASTCLAHKIACPVGEGFLCGSATADATCTASSSTTFKATADASACRFARQHALLARAS